MISVDTISFVLGKQLGHIWINQVKQPHIIKDNYKDEPMKK